jgi:hypothetical protein
MKVGQPPPGALASQQPSAESSEPSAESATGKRAGPTQNKDETSETKPPGLPTRDSLTRVGGGVAAAVTVGAGVAAGVVVASQPTVDKSYFDHILVRDKPINEIPILMQHNAGNVPGSGSLPVFAENQTMAVGDVLDKTPVRGFELDLHVHEGQTVINHGGIFDPRVDDHPTVGDAINPIEQWLNEPKNDDEVVYIMLESYAGDQGTEDVLNQMETTFGDKLYTPDDHTAFMNANRRWPTAEELTADGPRVIVMSNNTGIGGDTAFSNRVIRGDFNHTWEDRSGLALLGQEVHPEIVPKIDTEKMDQLVEEGGIIKVDQVSRDDPRFFKPEDRDDLGARPDVTVGDTFYVSDETVKSIMFGIGVAGATGAATFGIASSVSEAVSNERALRNAGPNLRAKIAQTNMTDVFSHRAKDEVSPETQVSEQEILTHCRDELVSDITWSTLKAGAFGTLSIAGSCLSFAMLFPPAFPILSGIAIGTLVAGAIATGVATLMNRRRLNAKLDEAIQWESVQKALTNRQGCIQDEISKSDADLLHDKLAAKSDENSLNSVSRSLLAGSLVLRVSSMGKYAIQMIGKISWIATSAVMFLTAVVDAVTNYKDRQAKLEDIGKAASEAVIPAMDKRPYLFFGATPFEKWITANQPGVASKLGLAESATRKDILKTLRDPKHTTTLKAFREQATFESLKKSLDAHAKKLKRPSPVAADDRVGALEVLEDYATREVGRAARKDTFRSGVLNSLKIGAVVASIGFLFPPVTGFLLGAAVGVFVLGLVVSRIAAAVEERKFRSALKESMEKDRSSKATDTAQACMHEEYTTKLRSFLGYLNQGTLTAERRKSTLFRDEPSSTRVSSPSPAPQVASEPSLSNARPPSAHTRPQPDASSPSPATLGASHSQPLQSPPTSSGTRVAPTPNIPEDLAKKLEGI